MNARKGAIRPAILPIIIMPHKATRHHTRLNKTDNYSVSMPSLDALEFIDKHELYILSLTLRSLKRVLQTIDNTLYMTF